MMTAKDLSTAGNAMLNWMESQDIDPVDTIPLLTLVTVGIINTIAIEDNRDRFEVGRAVGRGIMAALKVTT